VWQVAVFSPPSAVNLALQINHFNGGYTDRWRARLWASPSNNLAIQINDFEGRTSARCPMRLWTQPPSRLRLVAQTSQLPFSGTPATTINENTAQREF